MIVLNILGYFSRNKQNSYAALSINNLRTAWKGLIQPHQNYYTEDRNNNFTHNNLNHIDPAPMLFTPRIISRFMQYIIVRVSWDDLPVLQCFVYDIL